MKTVGLWAIVVTMPVWVPLVLTGGLVYMACAGLLNKYVGALRRGETL